MSVGFIKWIEPFVWFFRIIMIFLIQSFFCHIMCESKNVKIICPASLSWIILWYIKDIGVSFFSCIKLVIFIAAVSQNICCLFYRNSRFIWWNSVIIHISRKSFRAVKKSINCRFHRLFKSFFKDFSVITFCIYFSVTQFSNTHKTFKANIASSFPGTNVICYGFFCNFKNTVRIAVVWKNIL